MTGADGPVCEPPEQEAAATIAAIRDRAESVRDSEVDRALARLDERGDLSAAERAAVERLADRIIARLVAVPERALQAPEADAETVETARELFG
jgi:glutamyl-tRNA reductase